MTNQKTASNKLLSAFENTNNTGEMSESKKLKCVKNKDKNIDLNYVHFNVRIQF